MAPDQHPGQTVGTVARQLGISVRTLHHWDHLGVVAPSGRTPGGYRVYAEADVARARRTLLFRELGMPLADIRDFLSLPAAGRRKELTTRREEVQSRIRQLEELVVSVDRLLAADATGVLLSGPEADVFLGAGWDPGRAAAARERWADSPQWAEYAERSADRTPEEWQEIVAATAEAVQALAAGMRAGMVPGSPGANALAEQHRQAMSAYFHCTVSMHVLIGSLFTAEPDFAASYDHTEPGLAAWIQEVINANALARGVDPATAVWG
ncbi:MerR family transcriptional regulator [Arthrobacter sp. Z1-15]